VNILYFAWLRERVGLGEETLSPPPTVETVTQLIDWLSQRSPGHAAAFADRKLVRAAIDQVHSQHSANITGAQEIAFFPPVTGGMT
jgi:sulfur-carrier protein